MVVLSTAESLVESSRTTVLPPDDSFPLQSPGGGSVPQTVDSSCWLELAPGAVISSPRIVFDLCGKSIESDPCLFLLPSRSLEAIILSCGGDSLCSGKVVGSAEDSSGGREGLVISGGTVGIAGFTSVPLAS